MRLSEEYQNRRLINCRHGLRVLVRGLVRRRGRCVPLLYLLYKAASRGLGVGNLGTAIYGSWWDGGGLVSRLRRCRICSSFHPALPGWAHVWRAALQALRCLERQSHISEARCGAPASGRSGRSLAGMTNRKTTTVESNAPSRVLPSAHILRNWDRIRGFSTVDAFFSSQVCV